MPTIQFIRSNRFGRKVGTLDTEMTPGVQQTLVDNGFAVYVNSDTEPSESPSDDTTRGRKRRQQKEPVNNELSL